MHTIPVASILDSFNPGDPSWGFWLNLAAIALSIVGPPSLIPLIVHFFSKPRKQLSYQTESDAALVDGQKDLGPDMEVLFRGGVLQRPTPINNARLIMYKIINTGAEVIQDDEFFHKQERKPLLRFNFAEANLILCAIHHTEPDDLIPEESRKKVLHFNPPPNSPIYVPEHARQPSFHSYVDLDGWTLQKGNAIILKFVTQGRVKMGLEGDLLGGKIVPYVPSPPVFTVPRILIGLLLAIFLVSSILVSGVFRQNSCVLSFSQVNIGGSTAFYNTLQSQARTYQQGCPFVTVNVHSNDSAAGLLQLEQKNLDIAASEISLREAGYNYRDLTEHQVAVIVFTMIINKDVTGITSLSQEQITGIYDGQYTNWSQLHGPNLPITRFGRPSGSGTQAAFTRYVLQKPVTAFQITPSSTQEMINEVGSTKGSIGYVDLGSANQASNIVTAITINGNAPTPGLVENGVYPFWAIERMYTRNDNEVGSTKGSIGYVDLGSANQASNIVTAITINGNAPTPGLVENGVYPFWAIERMYTRNDAANSLILTFITYVTRSVQTNNTFIKMGDMQPATLATRK